jgi:cytochrome P450
MTTESIYVVDGRQDSIVAPRLEREIRLLREERGTVIRALFPYGGEGWLAVGYEAAKELMAHPSFTTALSGTGFPRMRENGGYRPPWPRSISIMDPPEHTAKRRVLSKHLSVKRARSLQPRTQRHVERLLAQVKAVGPGVDLVPNFSELVPLTVMCDLLGISMDERHQFVPQAKALLNGRVDSPEEGERMILEINDYFADLLERRKAEPGDDILSALVLDSETSDVFTEDDLRGMGFSLLVAGHDAPAAILGGILYWLAHSPELFSELKQHPELIPQGMEEFLRFLPSGTGSRTRVALEDVEIGGVLIREGEGALPWVHPANLDPAAFEDPLTLDLRRQGTPHLRFGFGIHACLGQQLARMELITATKGVLDAFDRLEVLDRDPDWREQVLLRGPKTLRVTW